MLWKDLHQKNKQTQQQNKPTHPGINPTPNSLYSRMHKIPQGQKQKIMLNQKLRAKF